MVKDVVAASGGLTLCSKSKMSLIFNVPYVIAKEVQSVLANILQPNEAHCSSQINCHFFIEFCGGSWIKSLDAADPKYCLSNYSKLCIIRGWIICFEVYS